MTQPDGVPAFGAVKPICEGVLTVTGPPTVVIGATLSRADSLRVLRSDGTHFTVPVVDGVFVAVDASATFRAFSLQVGSRRISCQSIGPNQNHSNC